VNSREITRRLEGVSETASLDAQVLLGHILGKSRTWVLAHPDVEFSPEQGINLEAALRRLEGGEALAYVRGHWEFLGLEFIVNPGTLIPRPETELLVEQALTWLEAQPSRRQAADVGTGSGCIAITLARRFPDVYFVATDISRVALDIARQNAVRYAVVDRIEFVQADLLNGINQRFDLVCANLPYIPTRKLENLAVARREPALALDGGAEGLDAIGRLFESASATLAPGGRMLLEIEASQGQAVSQLAQSAFPRGYVQVLADLAGYDRLVVVQES
jgi:release factor glutamine methyltransferase